MPRIVHFEISANDPEKVVNFYKTVFGWDIKKWDGPIDYWMVTTDPNDEPGINGGISVPKELFSGTVNTVEVQDIDAYIEKVKKSNGQVVTEKMVIPGVGYQVYCKDVEGTLFRLHQTDPEAGK